MTIDEITKAVLILVRAGAAARFIFCMVKLMGADEDIMRYKKRAKNTVLFWIISESVWALRDIVFFYYK